MIYLASPYSHELPSVRESRYVAVCKAAAFLMETRGEVVYSPIAHSHPIERFMHAQQPHEFWMRQCMPMLARASSLVVLTLDGWQLSRGIAAEIQCWRMLLQGAERYLSQEQCE